MDSRTSVSSAADSSGGGGGDAALLARPGVVELPESLGYRVKKRLLGKPLTTEQLAHEKLSNPVALGVLASDCISSSAYGSEAMLVQMIGVVGLSAFGLLMPITGVVLFVLTVLTLCYREVVMVYTRAGGSYVVARENFGPRVAQVAAVALLIDYIVTVAVQTAAGTVAVLSLVHLLGGKHYDWVDNYQLPISVFIVLLLCWGNLRGIREAGKAFAAPAYLYMGAMGLLFVVAIFRGVFGHIPMADVHAAGATPLGVHGGESLLKVSMVFMLLRAFANGGTSLTGLEAISNGVSAFKSPQGRNARKTLVAMSVTLGTLVLGVSILAWRTHSIPYVDGSPSVLAQEGSLIFGSSWFGQAGLVFLQLATALILYTGANTSFNGFPFLASFVAEDSFLPRQLTRRGHRLAFSSGIITLTAVSLVLLIVTNAQLDSLLGLYAIGVFTGFFMAGCGLVKHFIDRPNEPKRAIKIAINATAAALSICVVAIFAVTKFTEGAWVVVVIFPLGVWALIKVNKRYRDEAATLTAASADTANPKYRRQVMYILVDRVDLAALKAISYARSLRPSEIRAVHFMIDNLEAEKLAAQWSEAEVGDLPLEVVQCPDRRITRSLLELITRNTADQKSQITLLIPERNYSPILGRLLHRRTADHIARAVGKLPNVVATIVPFDVVIKEHPSAEEPPVGAGVPLEK